MRTNVSLALTLTLTLTAGASDLAAQAVDAPPPTGLPFQLSYDDPATAIQIVYDLATGAVRPLITPETSGPSGLPLTACLGTAFSGFTSLTNLPDDELVDWGVKSCGQSDIVTQFEIWYRAGALDPSKGGPGAQFSVAFFGGTTGFGNTGTEIQRVSFQQLPGAFAPGNFQLYRLIVDTSATPICLPDGPVGWSFMNEDGLTGVGLANAPIAQLGVLDALEVYSPGPAPTGNYTGTFNFGLGRPQGSLSMVVREDPGAVLASSTVVNGTGVNPLAFQEAAPAILGQSWDTTVDVTLSPFTRTNATVVAIAPDALAPTMIPWGELLIDPSGPLSTNLGLGWHFVPVPKRLALIGATFHAQAAFVEQLVLPVGFALTNGIDVTIGF